MSLVQALSERWNAKLTACYSRLEQPYQEMFPSFSVVDAQELDLYSSDTNLTEINLGFDGVLFSMPAGDVKAAIGAETRREEFASARKVIDAGQEIFSDQSDLSRRLCSAYGELLIPLVGNEAAGQEGQRVSLSLAARYDHYAGFASSTSPKIGISWQPNESVNFRGTYSKSFRTPLLSQIAPSALSGFVLDVPNEASPSLAAAARDDASGPYSPASKEVRAIVVMDRIERHPTAASWDAQSLSIQQNLDFLAESRGQYGRADMGLGHDRIARLRKESPRVGK